VMLGRGARRAMSSVHLVNCHRNSKSIYLATGVDEPEGRMIVEWLARRLGIEAIR